MTNIDIHSFDTYRYVQEFKATGFTEEQAVVMVRTVLESKEYDFSKLATKEQLRMTEERLEAKISILAGELRTEMANMQSNIVKWMVGLMFAQSTLILGVLLKLFY